jgi:hypothetical protein
MNGMWIVFRQSDVHGLPLCWDFITVSPKAQPIEKLVMKLTTNAQMNYAGY